MAVKRFYFFGSYTSSIGTDKYFPLRNTSVNPVYQNTGNTGQTINGQTYTFVPNDGLYFDNPPTNFTNLLRGSGVNDSDISLWNVSNVTNMAYMFYDCQSLTVLDVSNWNVSSVTNMGGTFNNCQALTTLDVSAWDVSSVANMSVMFLNCTSLTSLDVSLWDVSSVTAMNGMFQSCTSLTTLDVSNWDVSSVTNMDIIFQSCTNFISDIDFTDPIKGSISLTSIRGMMAGTKSERLLLQAGNLQSPTNIAGNPSNWIASPNMKEVKLFGMPNDVDTTIGFGGAGAMTGEAWLDLLESFDITQSSIYKLSPTAYSDMEAHLQGLGYIDIADYLTQTNNNWTVIS